MSICAWIRALLKTHYSKLITFFGAPRWYNILSVSSFCNSVRPKRSVYEVNSTYFVACYKH
jgi:hypothetical protein